LFNNREMILLFHRPIVGLMRRPLFDELFAQVSAGPVTHP
jgi:hypothetical protein